MKKQRILEIFINFINERDFVQSVFFKILNWNDTAGISDQKREMMELKWRNTNEK